MSKISIQMLKTKIFAVTLVILSCAVLIPNLVNAQTEPLNLGIVSSLPATYFQNPGTGLAVGNTVTLFPYLQVNQMSIGGVLLPGICNVQALAPGSAGDKWIVNLISSDLKWSDGVPITSEDLAYSFGIFLTSGPYANLAKVDFWGPASANIQEVSTLNTTAITLTLNRNFTIWPLLSFLYAVYPYHYYKQFTGDDALGKTPILSGPGSSAYVPVDYTAGSTVMKLVANPYSPSWGGKAPVIPQVNLYFFTDEKSLVNSLAAGTIDGALITSSDVDAVKSNQAMKTETVPSAYQMMVYVRSTGYPFSSAAFRQALMYLINKNEINTSLYGGLATIGNPLVMLPSAQATYWPGPDTPLYNYDPNMATQLLKASGLVQSPQGKWTYPNGTALTVNVEVSNSDPNYVRAAQSLVQSMVSVGLDANPKIVDDATATNDWGVGPDPAKFDVLFFSNSYAPVPYRYLRNPFNVPGWQNATFKTLFADALADTNPTTSLATLKKAEFILANAAVINSVVIIPQWVAYNNQKYTNWEPAVQQATDYNVFANPLLAENVLTSVTPVGAATSSTSTTETTAPPMIPNELIVGLVVVVVLIAAAVVLMRRRRKTS